MKKLIIFDLDGVIFNSKENMRVAWEQVNYKLKLNIKFEDYFHNIGMPFEEILKKLGIKKNIPLVKKIYREKSIQKFNLVKIYPSVKVTLEKLKKKNYQLGIITSKEKSRTSKLLKKFKIKIKFVQCPIPGFKGKPNPYLLNKLIKKTQEKKKNTYYIGDTFVDYKFAQNSKINFIFCNYGYGKINLKSVKKINKFNDLLKLVNS